MEIISVCDSIEIVCVTPVKDILVNIFQKAFQSITIGFSYDIRSQLISADLSTSLLFHAIPLRSMLELQSENYKNYMKRERKTQL